MRHRKVHAIHNPLRIRVVATASEARRALRGGYCPVECGFGRTSVVCRLGMDHHGLLHERPGVAIRAYEEHFGARVSRPWFAVTGYADEDATWAIGSLAGLLPHPSQVDDFCDAPAAIRELWTRDWTGLARLINRLDTDPTRIDLSSSWEGRIAIAWRLQGSFPLRDSLAFYSGIDRWRSLLTQATPEEIDRTPELLEARLERVRSVRHERAGRHVVLLDGSVWGFAVPYAWEWHRCFRAPVLFVYQHRSGGRGTVTVCVRDDRTARRLYGDDGLLNLFPQLEPRGWGGRPLIGGSPRGRPLTWEQARAAARVAAATP